MRSHALIHRLFTGMLLALVAGVAPAAWEDVDSAVVFEGDAGIDRFVAARDGAGGTVAAFLHADDFPFRAWISRLSRTGTELWDDDGRQVEIDISAVTQSGPVAISGDGSGGAYVAWVRDTPTTNILVLAHRAQDGSFDWVADVDVVESSASATGVKLVAEAGTGVTIGYAPGLGITLWAQRFDANGTRLWAGAVNDFYPHHIQLFPSNTYTDFDMCADGQGGVLFSWLRYDEEEFSTTGVFFFEIGAQRLSSTGARLWGSDGVMVWENLTFPHVNAYHARVLADGGGGSYVVTSAGSRAFGQHFDGNGSPTWATGGIVLQSTDTSTPDLNTDPQLCSDGTGGLILIQQRGRIHGQRVDVNGNKLWGPAGLILAAVDSPTEFFDLPDVDADGFGGAVVAWRRFDDGAESVGGLRVDAFGAVLWNDEALGIAGQGSASIEDVQIVADGRGGAHVLWLEEDATPTSDRVYALGVDGLGQTPTPFVLGLTPDAGDVGDFVPVLIGGEYLDETYTYELARGGSRIGFGPSIPFGDQLIGTSIDLSGASLGAWDLVISAQGAEVSRLVDAFGVGSAPGCPIEVSVAPDADPLPFGTPRTLAIDADGIARAAHAEWSLEASEYILQRSIFTDEGASAQLLQRFGASVPSDIAYAIDDQGRDVAAFWLDDAPEILHVEIYDGPESVADEAEVSVGAEVSNPTMAIDGSGTVHVVATVDVNGTPQLEVVTWTEGSWSLDSLGFGTNTREPDLVTTEDGVALVFVRASFVPGIDELCLSRRTLAGWWTTPEVIAFAFSIRSPTLASDGAGDLLIGCITDNSLLGSPPTLTTVHIENGTPGPVRLRATDGEIHRVLVASPGPDSYLMLTQETGQPMQFFLRAGTGDVFFSKRRLNAANDVDWPTLAASPWVESAAATWIEYPQGSGLPSIVGWVCATNPATAIPPAPTAMLALRAFPNPFNPSTELAFDITHDQRITIDVFDVRGRRVRRLVSSSLPAGPHTVRWNGRDDRGHAMASGLYFARLRDERSVGEAVKLILVE